MSYQNIISKEVDRIGYITINREKQLNALNSDTIDELNTAFSTYQNNKDIRVIILTGAGEKAFVAGADIKEFANFNESEAYRLSSEGQNKLFDFVENMNKPVIAAVNGFALGGGLELALSCHVRVASNNARMGLPETSLGLIPGYGGTQRLAQNVGKGKANEMIFTAGMVTAEEALKWGLVNHVCDQERLIEFCEKLASKMIKNSGNAIAAAIKATNALFSSENGFEKEKKEFAKCFEHEESKEGIKAFLEKRKADF